MAPTVVETTQGEVVILTYKQASKDIITAMQKAMTNTAKTDEQAPRKIPLAAHLGAELTAQDPAAHLGAELSCGDRETELVVCKPQSLATADRLARRHDRRTMCMYLHSCVQSDSNSHKHLQVC